MSPSDVVREFYKAFVAGDVPGIVARLAPDVVVDEPAALPYAKFTAAARRSCSQFGAR